MSIKRQSNAPQNHLSPYQIPCCPGSLLFFPGLKIVKKYNLTLNGDTTLTLLSYIIKQGSIRQGPVCPLYTLGTPNTWRFTFIIYCYSPVCTILSLDKQLQWQNLPLIHLKVFRLSRETIQALTIFKRDIDSVVKAFEDKMAFVV